MRTFNLILLCWITAIAKPIAQNIPSELIYPDTLVSNQDSFYIFSPRFGKIWSSVISKDDTLNLGTSGYQGVYMTVFTDVDTLTIPHVNYPYEQLIKIHIRSKKDTALCILRFQSVTSEFSDEYVLKEKGRFRIEIPETYELANIVLYLSACSGKTYNQPFDTGYIRRINKHFAPYKNHKLIQALNGKCGKKDYWTTYYGFRENSMCYSFYKNYLAYNTPYKQVFWDNSEIMGGEFRNLLYLVQDFADKSNFRKFFAENRHYYDKVEKRQSGLLPVRQMWNWLEKEFPQRMDSYYIVFSPLIGGSHSTQQFQKGFFREPEFQECVMFINSPESIDSHPEYDEKFKEGLMSGIVFTEIDHNYVNPTSYEFIKDIKNLIYDKNFWATEDAQKSYGSEYAIFNEYITHSLFCLYVSETYNESLSAKIIEKRIDLMERRGYPKFRDFNGILLGIMKNRKETIYESYKAIIEAMKGIK